MDDIAAALGISKRTLYEVFSDKESLLKECILKAQADRDKYLQKIFEPVSYTHLNRGSHQRNHHLRW